MASKLFSKASHLQSKARLEDSVVCALCTSFREGRNWDAVTREFGALELNDSSVEQVLLHLNSPTDAKAALGFFHWAAKRHNGFQHATRSYCIAIHLLLGARLVTDARALLQSLAQRNTDTRTVRAVVDSLLDTCHLSTSRSLAVNLFIQAYAKAKLTDLAFDACRYVEDRGFSVSVVSFNALLHAVQRSHECGLVWDVYEFMIRRRAYPNVTSLRIMVDALCKEGELQKSVDTLDRIMRKRTFRSPSMIVNCGLMLRIMERGHVAESERDVVVLLKRLLQKNLLHETVVYSLIVHAKVVFGDLDSARGLFMEMVRRGFEGNAFVYNSFIGAFCRDGRIEEAVGLMREMEGKGLEPYGETFEHILVGCAADSERLEECLRAFEEMVKVGFVPGCLVFNEVVERLCERGYVEKANEMLTVLLDRGFLPNDVTYCRLMQGYAEKEEVQEVLKLYYEMEYRSVSPGLLVFVAIIRCLCRCGKVEDAERYLRIMKGRSVSPDVTVYEALIDGYAKKGDSGKAICLREEMASLVL
ncbi:pentatricopeptide repeat-containing protein At1g66345, mitochondrial [Cajanus cajan]|uniref:pentatricopeptide repeat-containing protein At1g66345, mitochondrial n=1 Tax=Cajanus cajan TaxID=3821 RepID=UPI00098DC731|nr:pentatricopeptide repeat-containing protein At1g66345, mitochondrial [Cajanus cajan]XP_020233657.1 pentatricopeptide repeat-containing protein At1g66345, mitochondrial [Cajanus cajan]XP_029126364.1 pentatricopeptide repeat-containing protein At1g66345, mitochondrial [Cajanus cajan]XP_029126365.1 pentatricopeptide repeat-containing protein At1g66345, mitochondrial [Cajanus cajan]XP_029126366.1 pentatricopeptide repeat-containing protein At1g66345, mitochondrial [Cajanus cajan]XP_029126367.1 